MLDSSMPHDAFIPSLAWIAPFAILLLGIAVFPLLFPHLWESNLNKLIVSTVLGGPVIAEREPDRPWTPRL